MSGIELDPREDKLPKWARTLMEDLRRDAVMARREAATARAENPANEYQWAWLDRWGQEPFPLPVEAYERITCTLPGESPAERGKDRMSIKMLEDGSLEVMGHMGTLSVSPTASNVVRVRVDER